MSEPEVVESSFDPAVDIGSPDPRTLFTILGTDETPRQNFNRRKLITFYPDRPKGLLDWVFFLWGADIFVMEVPLLKFTLLLNLLFWWLLA